jgi:repressor LexA
MQKTVNERIKFIRKTLNFNQAEFASLIGITQTSISQIEKGKNGPSLDSITAIVNKLNISPRWILNGEGSMIEEPASLSGLEDDLVLPKVLPKVLPNSKSELLGNTNTMLSDSIAIYNSTNRVPILDQRAYAGSPGGFADQQGEDLQYISLPNLPSARTLIGIEVYGDSMSPTILEGDILVCAQILKPLEIKHLGIYVICMLHDGASVKRYYGPEDDYLLFKSDNPQHSSLKVIPDESIQLWEVLYRVTGSFPQRTELSPDWMHQVDSNIAELKRSLKALQTPKK